MRLSVALLLIAGMAHAEGEKSGEFDYHVLALSWSPNWCALEGAARGADQCSPDRDLGWILHGLWPQYERGWPSYCPTDARDPSREDTAAMTDIMGSAGLAWHQWKKHGRCSGLSADGYFDAGRRAYEAVNRPAILRDLTRDVKLPASLIEEAFIQANPSLAPDMITVTCKSAAIQEVRICLSQDLEPRQCGADIRRDCALEDALFHAID